MNSEYRGVVVKVTQENIVLLCNNGVFKNVPRAADQLPAIGSPFIFKERKKRAFGDLRYLWASSVVALFVLAFTLKAFVPAEESYVLAIDINPSIEIYTDENLEITNMIGLNEDGEQILSLLKWKGENAEEILEEVIDLSVEKGYLKQEGQIGFTVVNLKDQESSLHEELGEKIETQVHGYSLGAEVIIRTTDREVFEESHKLNISVNHYLQEVNKAEEKEKEKDRVNTPSSDNEELKEPETTTVEDNQKNPKQEPKNKTNSQQGQNGKPKQQSDPNQPSQSNKGAEPQKSSKDDQPAKNSNDDESRTRGEESGRENVPEDRDVSEKDVAEDQEVSEKAVPEEDEDAGRSGEGSESENKQDNSEEEDSKNRENSEGQ